MASPSNPQSPSEPREPSDQAVLSLEEALASQDWADLGVRLTRYAYVRLRKRSWETAEELAQEAIMRVLDPAYASWDRERHPDLFDCLGHVVNGLAANYGRKIARSSMVPIRDDADVREDDAPFDPRAPSDDDEKHAPSPDAVVLTSDGKVGQSDSLAFDPRAAVAMATLRARVAGDALVLGLLDQIQSGEGKAARQAKALGVHVTDVYDAQRRLMHHVRAVARDLKKGES